MVIQRLEVCLELLKMAIEFVIVVAEAVGIVFQHNVSPPQLLRSSAYATAPVLPFIGLLP
ncbi:hypothetical protein FNV43_RR22776 [Rhamnella rubrinervis]|uniref:Uncharacterized protein n=1 Tax=Rhamnella rubrinervis TaxID=2594499 RepID=A0A8K0GVG7_9ROSA|nr:hypothetical protein FNV43_RR22776 [Rhamnella rubrinervis]